MSRGIPPLRHARKRHELGGHQLWAPWCGAKSDRTAPDEEITCSKCCNMIDAERAAQKEKGT